jgi:preprotein translocase subunit SecG
MLINLSYFAMTLLAFAGIFLIGLILLQRGRGGGLAGAFGGMGGQSFLGTKAGDVFTRITIGVASAWILLCAFSVILLHNASVGRITAAVAAPVDDGKDSAEKDGELSADPKPPAGAVVPAEQPKADKAEVKPADAVKKTEGTPKDAEAVPAANGDVKADEGKPADPVEAEKKPVEPAPAEPKAGEPKPEEPKADAPKEAAESPKEKQPE